MAKPKDHYVPQFYLRNFANSKGQVKVFDRTTHAWRRHPSNIKDVSAEKDFYTIHGAGEGARVVESLLARIEGEASVEIKAILQGHKHLDHAARWRLSFFILLQFLRTKSTRMTIAEISSSRHKMRAELTLRYSSENQFKEQVRSILEKEPTDEDVAEYKQTLQEFADGSLVEDSTNQHILAMLKLPEEFAGIYAKCKWTVLKADAKSFITSDHPVCLVSAHPEMGVGLMSADSAMMPLSDECLLQIDLTESNRHPEIHERSAGKEEVHKINAIIAENCESFLFAHPDTRLPAKFRYPRLQKHGGSVNGIDFHRGQLSWDVLRPTMMESFDDYVRRTQPGLPLPEGLSGANLDVPTKNPTSNSE